MPKNTELLRLRIEPELLQEAKVAAENDHRTLSEWVRNAIRARLSAERTIARLEREGVIPPS